MIGRRIIMIFTISIPMISAMSSKDAVLRLTQVTMASCTYDKDCTENAYCWNHETCYCMEGYLVNRNQSALECLKIASEIGDPCTLDVQCHVTFTAQAECRNNICVCSEGSHYESESKRCYESIGIGHMCQTSYNCHISDGSPSFCVDGFCRCPRQHHPNGKECLKSAFLGDQCSIDDECFDLHSHCTGTCTCKVGYVRSSDGKQCLKAAESMGDPCIEDSQCTASLRNSKCGDDNTCTCLVNLKLRGSSCFRKLNSQMLGKGCVNRAQCVEPTIPETALDETDVTNVDCINGRCSCAVGYTQTEAMDDCIRFSENGTSKSKNASVSLLFSSILIYLAHLNQGCNKQ
ncbi:prion-like-(Q/N-rich) domain-bearing protein 25 isoform X2 [Fopius arisanus]|uniref:Prion-like-(Q/N-rich) domain-bearing protein 25 isoform X2 n=1 Tax=Fopius arisanus TaxID=64838 RepID=A0A9R1STD4_9HYME|nr:PREDICTED: prion-like-(Q/N-rich) domain-bearing protein 25 isoform X2 [Fopius arisanus]XP_011296793.1 PREDICTED: prion-like-(Q/N-rich) domain-bearing protein 25 isoform X2 [Fopius arisanus]